MAAKARKYNPKRDYGTRGSEVDKFTVPFAGKKATVYRRKDSGASTWHMRVYLPEEGIHYRKSLRTSDRREALEFAQREFVNLMALRQQGLRVTSPTFIEACRAFTKDEEKRLADGLITKQTYKMHQFYISRGVEYANYKFPAGIRTRLSEIDGHRDFADYLEWRQQKEKALRTSIEAELNGIRMIFKFAVKQRLATEKCVPKWEWDAGAPPKRRRMNDADYPRVLRILKSWAKKASGDVDSYNRTLLHHVFLMIASMGGRTGEVLGLRNSDIQRIDRDALEVVVNIRKETSKIRKDRLVTVMPSYGGRESGKPINYLIRWLDEHQIHKGDDDFVFALYTKGSSPAKDPLYRAYGELRKELAQENLEWFDLYHCRHHYAHEAIRAGFPLTTIANAMGNSAVVLEKTYSHLLSELTSREIAGKRLVRTAKGTRIVERARLSPSVVASE